jgi:hypothetical protein
LGLKICQVPSKKRKISKNKKITQITFTFLPQAPRKIKMKSNIWGVKHLLLPRIKNVKEISFLSVANDLE